MPNRVFTFFPEIVVHCLLAFVSGFTDALSYIIINVFSATQVANMVIGSTTTSILGKSLRLCVFASFVLAAMFGTLIAMRMRLTHTTSSRQIVLVLLALEILSFVGAWGVGNFFEHVGLSFEDLNDPQTIFFGSLLGGAMGIQNVVLKEAMSAPTATDITATLLNLVTHFPLHLTLHSLVDLLFNTPFYTHRIDPLTFLRHSLKPSPNTSR